MADFDETKGIGETATTSGNVEAIGELRAIRHLLAEQSAELLRGPAAAAVLGVSLATLYRMAAANATLKPVKVGAGNKRWRRSDLTNYVRSL